VLARGQIELPAHVVTPSKRAAAYALGVQIERASIVRIFPPDEVKAAFDEVAKAQEQIGTRVNVATQKKQQTLSDASGTVTQKKARPPPMPGAKAAAEPRSAFLKQLGNTGQSSRPIRTSQRALARRHDSALRRMKEAGRIDVLDHYLSKEGLTITQFPLMQKKK